MEGVEVSVMKVGPSLSPELIGGKKWIHGNCKPLT